MALKEEETSEHTGKGIDEIHTTRTETMPRGARADEGRKGPDEEARWRLTESEVEEDERRCDVMERISAHAHQA
jgi:hypothetical protein